MEKTHPELFQKHYSEGKPPLLSEVYPDFKFITHLPEALRSKFESISTEAQSKFEKIAAKAEARAEARADAALKRRMVCFVYSIVTIAEIDMTDSIGIAGEPIKFAF